MGDEGVGYDDDERIYCPVCRNLSDRAGTEEGHVGDERVTWQKYRCRYRFCEHEWKERITG